MNETVIRRAEIGDLPQILAMIRALAAHVGKGSVPKVSLDVLQSDGPFGRGNFRICVAEKDGGLVGMCLYTLAFSGWRGKSGLFIEDLYVDPAARGTGLGRRLMAAALETEAVNGAAYIKLEVSAADTQALAFYRKCGFTISATETIMVFDAL